MDYLSIIAKYYPNTIVECFGDDCIYSNIIHAGGDPIPPEQVLINKYIEDLKANKILELSIACNQSIISGFESSVLGAPHIYDSEEVDQLNLIGSVASTAPMEGYPSGFASEFACRPVVDGVIQAKEYKLHTYVQFRIVIYDGVQVKLVKLKHFNDLRTYITTTELTAEQIEAITFESEVPSS